MTAKLSKQFYDRFGEDVTNELVNWFNSVDATYRGELHALNEQNFARFDAKLGERLAELDAKWVGRSTDLDAKWAGRWTELDAKWAGRWTELDAKLQIKIAEVETRLVRWMFTFWVPTAVGIVATAGGVVALLLRR